MRYISSESVNKKSVLCSNQCGSGLLYPDISRPAVLISHESNGYAQNGLSSATSSEQPVNRHKRATAHVPSAGSKKKPVSKMNGAGVSTAVKKTIKPTTQKSKSGVKKTIKKKPEKYGVSVKSKPSTKRKLKPIEYPFYP